MPCRSTQQLPDNENLLLYGFLDLGHIDFFLAVLTTCRPIYTKCTACITKVQFACQGGLGHCRHADDIAAVAGHAFDFRGRFQPGTLRDSIGGTIQHIKTNFCTSPKQGTAKFVTEWLGKIDVSHLLEILFEKSVLTAIGVVNELVGKDDFFRASRLADTAHCGDTDDVRCANLMQCPEIRAIIYPVWRDRVPGTVAQ